MSLFDKSTFPNYLIGSFFFLLPLIYIPFNLDPVLIPRFTALALFLSIFFAYTLRRLIKDDLEIDSGVFTSGLFIAMMAFFALSAVSLFNAINISEGVFELAKLSLYILAFGALFNSYKQDSNTIFVIIKSLILANLFMFIISSFQFISAWTEDSQAGNILSYAKQISSTMANRNLFASANLIMIPFIGYGAFKFTRIWKLLAISVIAYLLLTNLLLQVRAVWLALSIATTTVTFAALIYSNKPSNPFLKLAPWLKVPLLAIPGILIASFMLNANLSSEKALGEQSQDRMAINIAPPQTTEKEEVDTNSVVMRFVLWQKTVKMIEDNPVSGVGLGNWKINLPKHGLEGLPAKARSGQMNFQRPHNDYLWVWAETGTVGIIVYLIIFVLFIRHILVLVQNKNDKELKTIGLLVLFGITGYLTIAFFSFPKERILHNIMLIALMAWVLAVSDKTKKGHYIHRSKTLLLVSLVIAIVSLWLGYIREKSEIHVRQIATFHAQQNWRELKKEAQKVNLDWYSIDPTSVPIPWYTGTANFNLYGPSQALEDFQKANKVHPYHIPTLINLGTCYELIGDHNLAIKYYQEAINISPDFDEPILNLCAVFYNLGRIDEAYSTLRTLQVDLGNPTFMKTLGAILPAKVQDLAKKTNDTETLNSIMRIVNVNDQLLKIHRLAYKSDASTDQLIIKVAKEYKRK